MSGHTPTCPFDPPNNGAGIGFDDPCPVCGMTGADAENDELAVQKCVALRNQMTRAALAAAEKGE